ncbi:SH3 domain-containing protein [Streptomyces sp. WAC06614]|nr:SH3 domain-containing protein [Streptomyces sp. WAC06614]
MATALTALAVPAVLVGTAGPAAATAACGTSGPNLDGDSFRMTAGVAANMRSGSTTSCGVTGWADNQDQLVYYCWTQNSNGATWTYLRNVSDGRYGWVSDHLLPNNGSDRWCGF